jgi:hypothetical protein
LSLTPLRLRALSLQNWRAAVAFLKAMLAQRRGDYEVALLNFERAMRCDRLRTSEHMAIYARLLTLNK